MSSNILNNGIPFVIIIIIILFQFGWNGVLLSVKKMEHIHILIVRPVLATMEMNELKYHK